MEPDGIFFLISISVVTFAPCFFLANGQGQTLEFGNSAASMGGEDVLGNCRVSTTRTPNPERDLYRKWMKMVNDINGSFLQMDVL